MRYPLHDMNFQDFEKLVAVICEKILGTGVIVFSPGKDGGRDAIFTGQARNFPSDSLPWDGKFIIQAKHTATPNLSCSDKDFITILKDELPKLKKIKEDGKVDYYLIFTNRKLSGLQHPKISDLIQEESLGIENSIFGVERIQMWLDEYPDIVKLLELNKLLLPIEFYEDDIRQVVINFNRIKDNIKFKELKTDYDKIPIEEKNKLNNLGEIYFNDVIKKSYDEFGLIDVFLSDPDNEDYRHMYNNTVSDLQEEIIINRSNYSSFEVLFNHLYKIISDGHNDTLLKSRRLIRVFLHYMYCNCDIGRKE